MKKMQNMQFNTRPTRSRQAGCMTFWDMQNMTKYVKYAKYPTQVCVCGFMNVLQVTTKYVKYDYL